MNTRTRAQVTISATNAFTAKWLVPRVASFREHHPGMDLQLHASDEAVDILTQRVDLAATDVGPIRAQPFGLVVAGHTYHLVMRADHPPSPSVSAAAEWLRSQVR
ncbi:LysR substrate-binding domain-containing protein [Stigmatella erecta]|uniref:LysR substrate binding domain-containing protein n=1 Tax=Stigmatella erecta TaxID=83460 RepID=A0A1I0JF80_9BACT|nr:LysR substrate-binding domain-containing protein [Stigmatella erecta]SEU08535.1 LysR substrate binding domain-containing protein [Stigmatella erecta]